MLDRSLVASLQEAAKRQLWLDFERMPKELEAGSLVMAEELISTLTPVPLCGRPDAVYLNDAGRLIPVETKVRPHAVVRLRDIVQLSAYRLMLERGGWGDRFNTTVAPYGYVRLVVHGRPRYCRVPLFDQVLIVMLWAAYWRCKA
jgi:hypothetical protein